MNFYGVYSTKVKRICQTVLYLDLTNFKTDNNTYIMYMLYTWVFHQHLPAVTECCSAYPRQFLGIKKSNKNNVLLVNWRGPLGQRPFK